MDSKSKFMFENTHSCPLYFSLLPRYSGNCVLLGICEGRIILNINPRPKTGVGQYAKKIGSVQIVLWAMPQAEAGLVSVQGCPLAWLRKLNDADFLIEFQKSSKRKRFTLRQGHGNCILHSFYYTELKHFRKPNLVLKESFLIKKALFHHNNSPAHRIE